MPSLHAVLIGLLLVAAWPAVATADELRAYVEKPDDSYHYRAENQHRLGTATAHVVRLQSQTWRGIAWKHWLTIIVPDEVKHPGDAIVLISAGSNHDGPPDVGEADAGFVAWVAQQAGVPVVIVQQVPNQPLKNGLYEDALIAHTFERYLDEGGDWPLLLPMVKSVVRAMDTATDLLDEKHGLAVDRFALTGASKRGWTTWLTAAVDDRVLAIAPMVIDMLNFAPQMNQQIETYGPNGSPMIRDYTERGLIDALKTAGGRRLVNLVDPYAYRAALDLPKLILLGTNDPYWTVDAANLYLADLAGPTHLHYAANTGHGWSMDMAPTMLAFFNAAFAGKSMPALQLEHGDDGQLAVRFDDPRAAVTLWQAASPNRDFREARWRSRRVEPDEPGRASVTLDTPDDGWAAAYFEVRFPADRPFTLTTPMTVRPRQFPHAR